ncbi:hypothetical protein [Pseudoalteromonas tunicata]|jgi:hypothetical protein|uniref:Uncharacterized protein n=1 Tax=Pseudoalteromonas tunicata D2 TaxID=87626 RepID=A4CDN2_9GAMM|nr:hypothetical protein [Pseudoalteromonas tunicata]ATC96436.1 hypothetical protein PTUN_a4239 [Pseudoalteromonas tunicata]AXT31921.1 hypothetical protein D1819_14575 [Pseudoalteromonas tunicata]EAR27074.1 hypothetical protein PTD2_05370 [Pseudoalteromonas tunicata D2]MDP4982242.1 hypothetical protein [Pseudoalteromonas tunicata]MDP5212335.1 hypothetical protein [Pseudoalteromonas tunicata]
MNSQFLDICGPLAFNEAGQATGSLRLDKYQGNMQLTADALLLEGIHQSAVRLGRTVIPNAKQAQARVLPVCIKSFQAFANIELAHYDVHCCAEPFGHSARVKINVFDQRDNTPLANAEITVALL